MPRESWAAFLLVLLLLVSSAPQVTGVFSRHPPPILPRLGSLAGAAQVTAPNYDEQIGLTFTDTFTSLKYNVTAVAQSNNDTYGPAYLLNGLTEKGYWYQVGLSWNWSPRGDPGTGFDMNYEVFDSAGASIFPTNGGGGLFAYSGPVNQGDKVELSLSFSAGNVVMYSKDLTTGALASISFNDEGASQFVGLLGPSDPNGFFSGLMTEEYHSSPYKGNVLGVNYTSSTPLGNGFLWADEFRVSPKTVLFHGSKFVSFLNPRQIQTFALNGTTEYANANSLVTGVLNQAFLTLSYSVTGGGNTYSAPILTFTLNGASHATNLTGTPTSFFADKGSRWEVSSTLPGSYPTERWATNQLTNGSLTNSLIENLVYYHQFYCQFGFMLSGGTGYSAPQVQTTVFGIPIILGGGGYSWVDTGASYFYGGILPGSTNAERWASLSVSGTVTQATKVNVVYYHQFGLTVGLYISGGGSPSPPTISGTQFGGPFSAQATNSSVYFFDPGTSWSVPVLLPGSNSQERWIASHQLGGNVSGPLKIELLYQHQFVLVIGATPKGGGSFDMPGGWEPAGSTVVISQTASQGWKFANWNGTGSGSYSGISNSSSIRIGAPIVENATFYPGLQISSGGNGEVIYSFVAQKGSVTGGTSRTIFVPQGTSILLQAAPSSLLYTFGRWSQGESAGGRSISIVLMSPSSVTASFSINFVIVGIMASAAVLVMIVVALLFRSRSKARQLT